MSDPSKTTHDLVREIHEYVCQEEAKQTLLSYTPRVKRAIQGLAYEAESVGVSYIGTEIMILACLRQRGVAARILERRGITIGQFEDELRKELGSPNALSIANLENKVQELEAKIEQFTQKDEFHE